MRAPAPVTVADLGRFDTLIDARSESEFALDRIPGAINCPVLDDEERRVVGTLYKQTGAFEARRVGGAMVAAQLARHLRERFADKPANWKPLVYCWRGGMRSGSMVTWLRLVGWDAQQLHGGYKGWRRHVIEQIAALSPKLDLRIVVGATGSAKTRVLQALERQGHQVMDLEGFAVHKGSLLGSVPGQPQPSQTAFETHLAAVLDRIDRTKVVFVEGESRRIGRLNVPEPLIMRMRASPCIEIDATPAARLAFLLRDYAYLGDDATALRHQLGLMKELHGTETITRWQAWAAEGNLADLFAELTALHYDPAYTKSQSKNFKLWCERERLAVDDLSEAAIEVLAGEVARRA